MSRSVRVKYLLPTDVSGARLYAALRAIAEVFGGNAADALDAELTIGDETFSIQRFSNEQSPLASFHLRGHLDGESGPLSFELAKRERRLTLRVDSLEDHEVRRFGELLVEHLTLQDATAIGLSLSGGGFRATLFHLGVIRFLKDADLLQNLTHVFSVSGGSINAAHLALNWERYLGSDDEFASAAAEVVAFTRQDVRGRIIRRYLLGISLFWLPWSRWRLSRIGLLQRYYEKLLRKPEPETNRPSLSSRRRQPAELMDLAVNTRPEGLPNPPDVHILATAMKRGALCAFDSNGFSFHSSHSTTYLEPPLKAVSDFPADSLLVASAVAASSAFPPMFPPLATADLGLVREDQRAQADDYLSDGGVFDNLGTRRFLWMRRMVNHELKYFFVSDAGAPFDWERGTFRGLFARTSRATDILMRRVGDLEFESASRHDVLFDTKLVRCDITRPLPDFTVSECGPADEQVRALVAKIRTDLDVFSPTEVRSLVWHGYVVAREAFSTAVSPAERTEVRYKTAHLWDPLPDAPKATVQQLREDLKESHRLKVGLHGWLTDPATIGLVGIPLLFLVAIVGMGSWTYRTHAEEDARTLQTAALATQRADADQVAVKSFQTAANQLIENKTLGGSHRYAFQIRYLPIDQIESRPEFRNAAATNPELLKARLPPLRRSAGTATDAPQIDVASTSLPNNTVSWEGVVPPMKLGNGSMYRFYFKGSGTSAKIELEFVQVLVSQFVAEGQSGRSSVAVTFRAVAERRPDGSYSADLKHPELGGVKIGEIHFTPQAGA